MTRQTSQESPPLFYSDRSESISSKVYNPTQLGKRFAVFLESERPLHYQQHPLPRPEPHPEGVPFAPASYLSILISHPSQNLHVVSYDEVSTTTALICDHVLHACYVKG